MDSDCLATTQKTLNALSGEEMASVGVRCGRGIYHYGHSIRIFVIFRPGIQPQGILTSESNICRFLFSILYSTRRFFDSSQMRSKRGLSVRYAKRASCTSLCVVEPAPTRTKRRRSHTPTLDHSANLEHRISQRFA